MNTVMRLIASLGFVSLLLGTDGIACKVSHIATAREITNDADVILLVRVPDKKIEQVSPIKMTVLAVLKGHFRTKTVIVRGQTAHYHGPNDRTSPYDFVRPGGRFGNCFAEDYKSGGQFLLFLRDGEVQWSSLAATNEEVSGLTDPWVVWVKRHVKDRRRSNQTMQRTASKAATYVPLVCHPPAGCVARFTGLVVADLGSR